MPRTTSYGPLRSAIAGYRRNNSRIDRRGVICWVLTAHSKAWYCYECDSKKETRPGWLIAAKKHSYIHSFIHSFYC